MLILLLLPFATAEAKAGDDQTAWYLRSEGIENNEQTIRRAILSYLGSKYKCEFIIAKISVPRGEGWSDLKGCEAIAYPRDQETLKFRVQLGLRRLKTWARVTTLDWHDRYDETKRAWEGRSLLEEDLQQLYGSNFYVADCETLAVPLGTHFIDAITAHADQVHLSMHYYVFTDSLDRRSEAEKVFLVFNNWINRTRIANYVFTVDYVNNKYAPTIRAEAGKRWAGEISYLGARDLYRQGALIDQLFNRPDLGKLATPGEVYAAFAYSYEGTLDQLTTEASRYLERTYGCGFVVDKNVRTSELPIVRYSYEMNAYPKEFPELTFRCWWGRGKFGDDFARRRSMSLRGQGVCK